MENRNLALLTNRCSLTYPNDKYHYNDCFQPFYRKLVISFLWNIIKTSTLCCCVSEFYCSSSTTIEKCQEGCCGKCKLISNVQDMANDSDTDATNSSELYSEEDSSDKSSKSRESDYESNSSNVNNSDLNLSF